MKRFLNYDFICHPYQVETELPWDPKVPRTAKSVDVTVFNFTSQLFSLLKDESLFGDISNLDVNPKKVFGRYRNNSKLLSTAGLIYDMAYKTLIEDKENDFLLPFIFACDETKLFSIGKTSCWPLMFTTTILNQEMRNKSIKWRQLG